MSDKDNQEGLGYQPVELTADEKEAYYHERMLNLIPEDLPEHLSEAWLLQKQGEAMDWFERQEGGDALEWERPRGRGFEVREEASTTPPVDAPPSEKAESNDAPDREKSGEMGRELGPRLTQGARDKDNDGRER